MELDDHRYDRDRKPEPSNSKPEIDKRPVDRKLPSIKPTAPAVEQPVEQPSKSKPITATELLEEEDPQLAKLMGFSRFSTTKGKKHEDYGAVDVVKKRSYRQYMNRPGGFNRPLDSLL
jgi:U4/U6.U5 tri-snRNP-associated protein 3